MTAWYLDASAIVKLVVPEDETPALRGWRAAVTSDALVTCELAVTEVLRAVGRAGGDVELAQTIVDGLRHVVVDRDLLLAAGRLPPPVLRTLDALHLAAATTFGDELAGIVTYDARMADAAASFGLPTLAPGT